MRFTRGDVIEITGISENQFNRWCDAGIISPEGGEGKGAYRTLTLMQVIGLTVALKLYKSERGCVLAYVSQIVSAFAGITLADLLKKFRRGQMYLNSVQQGSLWLSGDGKQYGWVNVEETYREVIAKVDEIKERAATAEVTAGRSTGLASNVSGE